MRFLPDRPKHIGKGPLRKHLMFLIVSFFTQIKYVLETLLKYFLRSLQCWTDPVMGLKAVTKNWWRLLTKNNKKMKQIFRKITFSGRSSSSSSSSSSKSSEFTETVWGCFFCSSSASGMQRMFNCKRRRQGPWYRSKGLDSLLTLKGNFTTCWKTSVEGEWAARSRNTDTSRFALTTSLISSVSLLVSPFASYSSLRKQRTHDPYTIIPQLIRIQSYLNSSTSSLNWTWKECCISFRTSSFTFQNSSGDDAE